MKKEYLIGLLTGCLLTASALMFIGATDGNSANGRYQLIADSHAVALKLLDTSNGQLYKWERMKKTWKKSGKPVED